MIEGLIGYIIFCRCTRCTSTAPRLTRCETRCKTTTLQEEEKRNYWRACRVHCTWHEAGVHCWRPRFFKELIRALKRSKTIPKREMVMQKNERKNEIPKTVESHSNPSTATAGFIVSKARSTLLLGNVNKLFFLACNFKRIKWTRAQ